jgi:type II secretory pathway pseudopilin PulG
VIIGILASIAIPTFLAQRQRGWQAQLFSDVRNAILDVEAGYVTNNGLYPATQSEFNLLGAQRSDPATTFAYTTNSRRTEFCVLGTDTRQPPGDRQLAHYVSGSGVQIFSACPAFSVP